MTFLSKNTDKYNRTITESFLPNLQALLSFPSKLKSQDYRVKNFYNEKTHSQKIIDTKGIQEQTIRNQTFFFLHVILHS